MIGITSQYIFIFSIGDREDFILPEDFKDFVIIEEAGNVLPTWQLNFKTSDSDLLKYMNEGNDLNVSFGVEIEKMDDISLTISDKQIEKEGHNSYVVEIAGVFSALPYINIPYTKITTAQSGVETLIDIASKYFRIDTNIAESEDEQNWIQPNISDKSFMDEVWLHSYLSDSFLGVGINSLGTFVIRDIKQALYLASQKDAQIVSFVPKPDLDKPKELAFSDDYMLSSESGFINCFAGYGKVKPVLNLETGVLSDITESIIPLAALTSKLNRKSTVTKRASTLGIHNDNVHSNYWNAALRNVSGLSLFSSEGNTFSFYNSIVPKIQIFDVVSFKDTLINSITDESAEEFSGLWIVGLVSRVLTQKKLVTTAQIYRENYNSPIGSMA